MEERINRVINKMDELTKRGRTDTKKNRRHVHNNRKEQKNRLYKKYKKERKRERNVLHNVIEKIT